MAVPPSLTYSATTPWSRRFTSSMNAGGNDHSRPTSRPTFSMGVSGQAGTFPGGGGVEVYARGGGEARSIGPADVMPDHVVPDGPVVRQPVPDPQRVPDALAPEQPRQVLVGRPQRVVAAHGQDDAQPPQGLQPRGVVLVVEEVAGVVEVDRFVVVTVREPAEVAQAAHAQNAADLMGVAQAEVEGVVAAEAGAGGDQERVRVLTAAERQHFLDQAAVVLVVPPGALGGVAPAAIPALAVEAVHAVEL